MRLLWKGKPMRLLSLIILTAGLLLVLPSCSTIPGFKSPPTPTRPLEILQKSVERLKDTKSFRSSVDVVMSAMGERMVMAAEIEVASDGRVQMFTSMDGPDGDLSFAFIVSDPDLYLKMPEEDWVRIPGGAVEGSMDDSLPVDTDLLGSFFSNEEIPLGLVFGNIPRQGACRRHRNGAPLG